MTCQTGWRSFTWLYWEGYASKTRYFSFVCPFVLLREDCVCVRGDAVVIHWCWKQNVGKPLEVEFLRSSWKVCGFSWEGIKLRVCGLLILFCQCSLITYPVISIISVHYADSRGDLYLEQIKVPTKMKHNLLTWILWKSCSSEFQVVFLHLHKCNLHSRSTYFIHAL